MVEFVDCITVKKVFLRFLCITKYFESRRFISCKDGNTRHLLRSLTCDLPKDPLGACATLKNHKKMGKMRHVTCALRTPLDVCAEGVPRQGGR